MKSTKVQTLGEMRMRGTANWWVWLLCVYSRSLAGSSRRVWHGLATVVDSKREGVDTRPSLSLLVPSRCTEQADPVACANLHIGFFTCFSRPNFWTRHFYDNRHFINKASVALNRLVSLFYLFCERGNRRTEPSTVTLAAHARRGLKLRMGVMLLRVGVSTCKARGGGIVVIVATLL